MNDSVFKICIKSRLSYPIIQEINLNQKEENEFNTLFHYLK